MKKSFLSISVFLSFCFWGIASLLAQAPQALNYQAVAKNADGSALADQAINVQISILSGIATVGIAESNPSARLHIGQQGQQVGRGLRFDDGTANEDWDITHGFSLRFHYGGDLRGFINANNGAYTQSSDRSLKSDIEDLENVLSKVNQLQVLSYHYTNAQSKEKTIGFIAQDVAPIFPELVHYSEADNLYGINYSGFGVVAIKAIQEQQEVIEKQAETIESLQERLEALEAIVSQLSKK